jgi:hypothetical protein
MELVACLTFVFAPLVLVILLGRTKFFWLPGVALMALPVVAFAWLAWKLGPGFDDASGDNLAGLPVTIIMLAVVGSPVALYGFICLLGARSMRRRALKDQLPRS